jgi:hypothetical protein
MTFRSRPLLGLPAAVSSDTPWSRVPPGVRWRFTEHRQDPPLLPPRTSWMQGAAGIAAFLLRFARVLEDGPAAAVVDRPDQWWAVPERLCVSRGMHRDLGTGP